MRRSLGAFSRIGSTVLLVVTPPAAFAACGADAAPSVLQPNDYPAALQRILGNRPAPTNDVFAVFICEVPLGTTDPVYGDRALRLTLSPTRVATLMEDNVRPYFEALSDGRYHPHFTAGQTLRMKADETHDQCVERAVDASGDDIAAVMVVANAEHLATEAGGWGRPGETCNFGFCPASTTRRAFYVGASDFHADWGPVPLLDLIEHEIGHTLGLPHSGDGTASENRHTSALDVMSNSAAPRELSGGGIQKDRKHAQDTLAINRLSLGWLPPVDVIAVAAGGGRFTLSSSAGANGLRLLVLPRTDDTFLTVEYLVAEGFDDFLPESGVAVHRIEDAPAACARAVGDDRPCSGIDRAQITLGSPAPHLDLLDAAGESWVLDDWTITVTSAGNLAGVEVRRTER